jgi:hypothetical protein
MSVCGNRNCENNLVSRLCLETHCLRGSTSFVIPMARPRNPVPSLLVVVCFSRHLEVLAWAQERLQETYCPIALVSPDFDFHQTKYYEATMGPGLKKRILAFQNLVPGDSLADAKLFTNDLEEQLAQSQKYPEVRPLNLDPGLIQLGKFLLASTKDQAHRIYLRDGIYAEVTLRFHAGAFELWPWTYRDYQEPAIREFLGQVREYYRQLLAGRR